MRRFKFTASVKENTKFQWKAISFVSLLENEEQLLFNWKWIDPSPSKLLDRRVSIAPQQPLPVLSVSHFLPRNIVRGRTANPPSAALQYSPSCLLSPANYSTRAVTWRDTLAFSALSLSCIFFPPSPACSERKNVWELVLQLTREKHQCSHRSQCVWLMHQDKNAQTVKSASTRLYTKQMCNRNLMWGYKSPFSHDRYWNWYWLRLKQTHLHTRPFKQLENKSLHMKNVFCWLITVKREQNPVSFWSL